MRLGHASAEVPRHQRERHDAQGNLGIEATEQPSPQLRRFRPQIAVDERGEHVCRQRRNDLRSGATPHPAVRRFISRHLERAARIVTQAPDDNRRRLGCAPECLVAVLEPERLHEGTRSVHRCQTDGDAGAAEELFTAFPCPGPPYLWQCLAVSAHSPILGDGVPGLCRWWVLVSGA